MKQSVTFLGVLIAILIVASQVNAATLPVTITPENLVVRDSNGNIIATSLTVALINNTDGYVQLARAVIESGSSSFPTDATVGRVFYRTDLQALYIYSGSAWITAMSATLPPGTISYNDLSDKPDLTVYLLENGTAPLTANWNVGSYGVYGVSFLNSTSVSSNVYYIGNYLVIDNSRNAYFAVVNASGYFWNGLNRTDVVAYPFESYSYLVTGFSSVYRAKNGTTGQFDISSSNASYVLNTVFGLITGPPVRKVVLLGNFTIDHAVVVRSYTYVDATQAVILVAPAVTVDAVQFVSGCTLSEWHGGTIISNGG